MAALTCVKHPRMPANKQCTRCQRGWCEACTRKVHVAERTIESCPHCNAPVREPTPGVAAGADESWGATLLRPFSVEALLTALAIAVPSWIASFLSGLGALLFSLVAFACVTAYYFQTIDHIGRGRPGMPEPTGGVDSWGDVISLTWRGCLCIVIGFAPFLYWFFLVARGQAEANPFVGLGMLLVGQAYMPAAILCVVITDSNVGAIWPPAWIQIMARAPASYLALVGLYIASLAAGWFLRGVLGQAALHVPFVGTLLAVAIGNALTFVQAAVVGGFLRRNAEHFGYD
jgi:hypothetical protein